MIVYGVVIRGETFYSSRSGATLEEIFGGRQHVNATHAYPFLFGNRRLSGFCPIVDGEIDTSLFVFEFISLEATTRSLVV